MLSTGLVLMGLREQDDRLLSVCLTGRGWKHRGAAEEATDKMVVGLHCGIAAVRKHTRAQLISLRPLTADISVMQQHKGPAHLSGS